MFCNKCGNQLEDSARFCDKCGNSVGDVSSSIVKEKRPDNEVNLEVKPTFKLIYFLTSPLISCLVIIILFTIIAALSGEGFIGFIAGLVFSLVILAISALSALFKKLQLKNMEYSFYNTKVVYKDSFLNQAEKEVKYKHIRECVLVRTWVDRIFGYGRIVLYTNAESGFGNGIIIPFIENSNEIYKRIKELLED